MISKTTRASRRKAAKNVAWIAAFQATWRKERAKGLAKLAKKPGKAAKAARKAAMIAAAEARGREVRAKKIANRPGTPLPDVDAPGTRFDVNYYSSGPSYIRDIGVIEKRKK